MAYLRRVALFVTAPVILWICDRLPFTYVLGRLFLNFYGGLKILVSYVYSSLEIRYLFYTLIYKDFFILNLFKRFVNWCKGSSTFYDKKTKLLYKSNSSAIESIFFLFFSVILLSIFSLSSYFIFLLESINAISTEVSNILKVSSNQWFWEDYTIYKFVSFDFISLFDNLISSGNIKHLSSDVFTFYSSR